MDDRTAPRSLAEAKRNPGIAPNNPMAPSHQETRRTRIRHQKPPLPQEEGWGEGRPKTLGAVKSARLTDSNPLILSFSRREKGPSIEQRSEWLGVRSKHNPRMFGDGKVLKRVPTLRVGMQTQGQANASNPVNIARHRYAFPRRAWERTVGGRSRYQVVGRRRCQIIASFLPLGERARERGLQIARAKRAPLTQNSTLKTQNFSHYALMPVRAALQSNQVK
jgi:hypothetical protein